MKNIISKQTDFESLMLKLGITPAMRQANLNKQKPSSPLRSQSLHHSQSPDINRVCVDGERTHYLTRLAGSLIQKGMDIEDIKRMLLDWNSNNQPPLDNDKVISTCESILLTHQRKHLGVQVQATLQPLFDVRDASTKNMLSIQPPEQIWLLTNCLPYGKVGMLIAPGGTGKSMFALQLAIAVATGGKFLGHWEVGNVGTSLLLFAEEDTEEIHRRLHRIASTSSPEELTNIGNRVLVKSMAVEDNLMTRADKAGNVTLTEYVDRLELTVKDIADLKLIVVDPASRFRGGNENAAEDTTRFVQALERLRHLTGATILVVHHVNKGSTNLEANQNAARGSSAMTDGVRWQMNLHKPSAADIKKYRIEEHLRQNYLLAAVTKNNYGPPQSDLLILRGDGGILHAANQNNSSKSNEEKIIELIKSEANLGKIYSANKFEKQFGGQEKNLQIGTLSVRKLILQMIRNGQLRKANGSSGHLEVVKNMVKPDIPIHRKITTIRKN